MWEFQTAEASSVNHKKQWKVTDCLKMPFCLQKQLRKQLTGAVKPGLLLLCHSWNTTIPPGTVLSECRDSLDQKSRLPRSLPWQTARSEVKTQSQSLTDWQSGTKSQTGQECPRCWPREKATTYPSPQKVPQNFSSSISAKRDQVSPTVHGLDFSPRLWQTTSLVHFNIQSASQVAKNASMSL